MKITIITSLILFAGQWAMAQWSPQINMSVGSMTMISDHDKFKQGGSISVGFAVERGFKSVEGLSFQTGLEWRYNRVKFNPVEINLDTINIIKSPHEISIDYSLDILHQHHSVDMPLRLRYNGLGFMGIFAGVNLSHTLNWHWTNLESNQKLSYENKWAITYDMNVGLFFPVGPQWTVDLFYHRVQKGRVYTETEHEVGKVVRNSSYRDHGISLGVSYKW
ncbi:outer membrane beta-barrel protein [Membranihabitans marinus]|uniref:outer membrane beta-barrel protein n=1 Tax=Membranihabitans marinus TaxID=1227546 RepID=UPI001F238D53|nr:outer membrane beta-barrel protein [Membranihabitans marinus]